MRGIWNDEGLRASVLAGLDVAHAGNWCLSLIIMIIRERNNPGGIDVNGIRTTDASGLLMKCCSNHFGQFLTVGAS